MARRLSAAVLALASVLSLAGGCASRATQGGEGRPVSVPVAEVTRTRLEAEVAVSGTLAPAATVEVAPKFPGRVAEVLVREGDAVRAGQVLLRLDVTDAETQLRQATVAYESAAASLERLGLLYREGAISAQAYDQARAQADLARSQVEAAREQVRNAAVVAPVSGIVAARRVEPGEMASPAAPALTLVDLRTVSLSGTVAEGLVDRLRPGQEAVVTVEALPGRTFAGTLAVVGPVAAAGGRFPVRVDVPNPDGVLKAGMTARAALRVVADGALAVPESAVIRQGGRPYVFVVENGRARLRPVQTGLTAGGRVEVVAGLAAGQQVVAGGAASLADGQAVRPARP